MDDTSSRDEKESFDQEDDEQMTLASSSDHNLITKTTNDGLVILLPKGDGNKFTEKLLSAYLDDSLSVGGDEEWESLRILHARPRNGFEITNK